MLFFYKTKMTKTQNPHTIIYGSFSYVFCPAYRPAQIDPTFVGSLVLGCFVFSRSLNKIGKIIHFFFTVGAKNIFNLVLLESPV